MFDDLCTVVVVQVYKRAAFLWFSSEMTHFMAQTELHLFLRQHLIHQNQMDLKSCNHLSIRVSFATHQRYICKINLPNSLNRWLVTRVNVYNSTHNQLDTFVRFIDIYYVCIFLFDVKQKIPIWQKEMQKKKKKKKENLK